MLGTCPQRSVILPGTRYRPPAAASSAIITRPGYEGLRAELDFLWRRQRPEVVAALSAAAAEGDRSENAEYQYRKRQLAEIDRRVRYLTRRLERLQVVDGAPADTSRIRFGAWAELEAEDGTRSTVRLVGPDEIDGRRGWISIDAPLARALLGRRIDEAVELEVPAGQVAYLVCRICYESPDWIELEAARTDE